MNLNNNKKDWFSRICSQIQENQSCHRTLMLNLECKINAEIRKIKQMFLVNSYREYFITTTIEIKIAKLNGVKVFDP